MLVVATRDVPDRFRGFLASVMLEIGPGVYTGPQVTAGVRERIWKVLEDWFLDLGGGSIVMTWDDGALPGGQALRVLGIPPREFVVMDGVVATRSEPTKEKWKALETYARLGLHGTPEVAD